MFSENFFMLRIEERHFVDPRGTTEDQRTKILGEHFKVEDHRRTILGDLFHVEDRRSPILRSSKIYQRSENK